MEIRLIWERWCVIKFHPQLVYLNAIFFDKVKSNAPIALVIDDTISGTMRHFSIRKKRSPGYWMYIMSLCVHFWSWLFKNRPKTVPPVERRSHALAIEQVVLSWCRGRWIDIFYLLRQRLWQRWGGFLSEHLIYCYWQVVDGRFLSFLNSLSRMVFSLVQSATLMDENMNTWNFWSRNLLYFDSAYLLFVHRIFMRKTKAFTFNTTTWFILVSAVWKYVAKHCLALSMFTIPLERRVNEMKNGMNSQLISIMKRFHFPTLPSYSDSTMHYTSQLHEIPSHFKCATHSFLSSSILPAPSLENRQSFRNLSRAFSLSATYLLSLLFQSPTTNSSKSFKTVYLASRW